ncbi:exported hypothetical protein (plasmid) [Methylorubrum extorquens AM1]|uniref:Uncharacterized protein n=1 Tax=Methylorubrum extorquens (strain ATCC 14718 / DSM 1338 / JCM 2805 / NCIMB 9133 / AM1) TaxID=272630 RepID=C5B3V9_METEA|nr:exported hypothetical protein [Methylorubrum extorquens AM1]
MARLQLMATGRLIFGTRCFAAIDRFAVRSTTRRTAA